MGRKTLNVRLSVTVTVTVKFTFMIEILENGMFYKHTHQDSSKPEWILEWYRLIDCVKGQVVLYSTKKEVKCQKERSEQGHLRWMNDTIVGSLDYYYYAHVY